MTPTCAEIDEPWGEDPEDRAVRKAHGFTVEDDFMDRTLVCRNGCGLSYYEVAVGKIERCRGRKDDLR